ncbi:MAG TPA: hypothetical protein V6D19_04230 [Stenomitos sp.]
MTRSKLSDSEKLEIVSLFEQQNETIPALAERYQVSSSTIRRLLKQAVSEVSDEASVSTTTVPLAESPAAEPLRDEEALPQKMPPQRVKPRLQRSRDTSPEASPAVVVEELLEPVEPPAPVAPVVPDSGKRPGRGRRRSQASASMPTKPIPAATPADTEHQSLDPAEMFDSSPSLDTDSFEAASFAAAGPAPDEIEAILEDIGRGLDLKRSNPVDEAEEDEDDFDDLGDDADDFEDLRGLPVTGVQLKPEEFLEVMPLAEATLPKTCYLVIDRTAELVTRPLKDFGELGQIPEEEVQACTLPVFDNHRVARRFSHRTQRVIKVPNGNMLKTACLQLSAKGITRLLVNGHIYAL